jgi:hypothetical protein
MMLPLALVSVLAAPVAAADAPVEVAPPPAPAPTVAAPAEIVIAPAPAPAEPAAPSELAPAETVTVIETPSSSVIVVQSAEPTPAPIVVVTPEPTISPPVPTWRPPPPPPYDAVRIQQTIRSHRRSAVGAFAIGSVGMTITLATQYLRGRALQHCAQQAPMDSHWCAGSMNIAFSRYGGLGMAMFVAGTGGAGAMLGNAAATRDVQLRGGDARRRPGLKLIGVAAIGAGLAWMVGANMQLLKHESQCEGDPGCLLRYRPLRWAANDGAALGIATGAGMLGYAIAYERQGKALMHLRAAPSFGGRHAGAAVTMRF